MGDGLVYLPGTVIPAVHIGESYQQVTVSGSGQQACSSQSLDFLSRPDGIDQALLFDRALAPAVPGGPCMIYCTVPFQLGVMTLSVILLFGDGTLVSVIHSIFVVN